MLVFYFADQACLGFTFCFRVIAVIRNADSLQLIKLLLNQMNQIGRVGARVDEGFCNCILSYISNLGLPVCIFLYFISSLFLGQSLTNSFDDEVWIILRKRRVEEFLIAEESLLVPQFIVFPTCVELMNSYSFAPHYAYETQINCI